MRWTLILLGPGWVSLEAGLLDAANICQAHIMPQVASWAQGTGTRESTAELWALGAASWKVLGS